MPNQYSLTELDKFIKQEIIQTAKERVSEIESVSYGVDAGCGFKNDVFVSLACNNSGDKHGDIDCMCREILNQESLSEIDIDLALAEKIANHVSVLIGGKRVYRG